MKHFTKPFLLLLIISSLQSSFAQQDAQFTQFRFNQLYFNPAYTGVEGLNQFGLIHRNQWTGWSSNIPNATGGAPQSTLLTYQRALPEAKSGIGAYVAYDKLGINTNIDFQLSYAYHLEVGTGKLSFGARGGVMNKAYTWDKWIANDLTDAILLAKTGTLSQFKPDVSLGVWYQSNGFFGGISANHLLEPTFDMTITDLANPLVRHFYANLGYNFELNENFVLTPSAFVKTTLNATQYELNVMSKINDQFYLGVNYRENDAVSAIIGLGFGADKRYRFTYSLDYTVPGTEAKRPTSHEVMLAYGLPVSIRPAKPIIRTPRFRK